MKKIMALLVVFALFAGVAFGQAADGISINAWGRVAFSPFVNVGAKQVDGKTPDGEEGESYSGARATWGGDKARVDFRINGSSELVGFNTQFSGEDAIGIQDNLHIWAKPFGSDILKFTGGKIADDTLRGKIGNLNGGFSNFVLNNTPEEDPIFNRFSTWAGVNGGAAHGYMISSAPIEGLFIGLVVNGELDPWWNGGLQGGTPVANAFRYMQIGAGYEIAGIGHFRAQYIGGWSGEVDLENKDTKKYYKQEYEKDDDGKDDPTKPIYKTARIEAAFALTAIDGLLIDLGGKFNLPLNFKDGVQVNKGLDFSLGAKFNTGIIGIGARVDASGLGAYTRADKDKKNESGMAMVARVVPTFALDFATVGLDVAFAINGESKNADGEAQGDNTSQIGFGAFLEKGLGKGSFKVGASYTLAPTNKDGKANGSGVFAIPIILEYAFF
jgi:hypothetical protein